MEITNDIKQILSLCLSLRKQCGTIISVSKRLACQIIGQKGYWVENSRRGRNRYVNRATYKILLLIIV